MTVQTRHKLCFTARGSVYQSVRVLGTEPITSSPQQTYYRKLPSSPILGKWYPLVTKRPGSAPFTLRNFTDTKSCFNFGARSLSRASKLSDDFFAKTPLYIIKAQCLIPLSLACKYSSDPDNIALCTYLVKRKSGPQPVLLFARPLLESCTLANVCSWSWAGMLSYNENGNGNDRILQLSHADGWTATLAAMALVLHTALELAERREHQG